MKAVNLFNPRNSKLKYEIINPIWEDGLLDPVTMRVQFPVLSRVHGVYLETSERLLTHVIEIAKREISQPGDPVPAPNGAPNKKPSPLSATGEGMSCRQRQEH
jgi:hypothetical protein